MGKDSSLNPSMCTGVLLLCMLVCACGHRISHQVSLSLQRVASTTSGVAESAPRTDIPYVNGDGKDNGVAACGHAHALDSAASDGGGCVKDKFEFWNLTRVIRQQLSGFPFAFGFKENEFRQWTQTSGTAAFSTTDRAAAMVMECFPSDVQLLRWSPSHKYDKNKNLPNSSDTKELYELHPQAEANFKLLHLEEVLPSIVWYGDKYRDLSDQQNTPIHTAKHVIWHIAALVKRNPMLLAFLHTVSADMDASFSQEQCKDVQKAVFIVTPST